MLFAPGVICNGYPVWKEGAMERLEGLDGLLFGVVKWGSGCGWSGVGLKGVHGGVSRVLGVRVLGEEGNRGVGRGRQRFHKLVLVARWMAAHKVSWGR